MLTSNAKRKLIAFGMFALPIGIVKVAATVLGGPAGAQAQSSFAVAPPPPPDLTTPVVELTSREQLVFEHITRLEEGDFGATPMLHARANGGPVVIDPQPEPGVPNFRVKGIMVSTNGNRALIDGKALKVGDEIPDTEWLIIGINGNTRSVTIQDPETGRIATGSVD